MSKYVFMLVCLASVAAADGTLQVTLSPAPGGGVVAVYANHSTHPTRILQQAIETNVLSLEVRDATGHPLPTVPPSVPRGVADYLTIAAGHRYQVVYSLNMFSPPLEPGHYTARVVLDGWHSNVLNFTVHGAAHGH